MSIECGECGRDARGGHGEECSRHPKNEKAVATAPAAGGLEAVGGGSMSGEHGLSDLISQMKIYADRHNLMEEDFLYVVGLLRQAQLLAEKPAPPVECQDYVEYAGYVGNSVMRNVMPMTFQSWITGRNG